MDKITLNDIAGYATERTVWRLIKELSTEGRSELWSPKGGQVDVWTIGAVAFHALMGVEVFGGKGPSGQRSSTPVPRIATSHCSAELGILIHRSLSFSAASRPSMEELRQSSTKALLSTPEAPRRLTTTTGKAYKTSLVKFWPEGMG